MTRRPSYTGMRFTPGSRYDTVNGIISNLTHVIYRTIVLRQ